MIYLCFIDMCSCVICIPPGLNDVKILTNIIKDNAINGNDIGLQKSLEQYTYLANKHNLVILSGVNFINYIFNHQNSSSNDSLVNKLISVGILGVHSSDIIKEHIASYAMMDGNVSSRSNRDRSDKSS
jgi:hypothetical protein